MKSLVKAGLLIISVLTLLVACGGGGGGSSQSTPVSGIASKGIIVGGTVKAYSIVGGAVTTTQIGNTATTLGDGSYSLDVGGYSGPLMVEVSGGVYTDEATNNPVTLATPLRAFIGSVVSGRSVTSAITPLTEIAARYADSVTPGVLTTDNINAANRKISEQFLGANADILTTSPSNVTYAKCLTAISALSNSGSSLDTALTSLKNNIVSNNGTLQTTVAITKSKASALIGGNDTITLTVSVLPVPEANTPIDFTISSGGATFDNGLTTAQRLTPSNSVPVTSNVAGDYTITATCKAVSASTNVSFAGSPTVTVTADKTTAIASDIDQISLTAVTVPAQPAGTDITFTISSGSAKLINGSTTSYTAKANSSGSAQVLINSAVIGSVTVTANCQGGTGSSPSLSFTAGVSSASSVYSAANPPLSPVTVVAYDPVLALTGTVNFVATGAGSIKVLNGVYKNNQTVPSDVQSAGTFQGKAVVYLKCDSSGTVTVTATKAGGSALGSATTSCFAAAGTSDRKIYLSPSGTQKLWDKVVSNINFFLVAGAGTNTASIVGSNSSFNVTAVDQSTPALTVVRLSPGNMIANITNNTSLIFTATYSYYPALPSFSVEPLGTATISGGSPIQLLPSDFEVR
jgi:hypothetical protein